MKCNKVNANLLRSLSYFMCCLLLICSNASATTFKISTASFVGQTGGVAFDLIDGGTPNNSFTLTNFNFGPGSSVASNTQIGGVVGDVASNVFFNDSSFFNELFVELSFGNYITFDIINATNLSPDSSSFPDAFSVFILDSSGQSLLSTLDPTGSDALFRWDSGSNPATNIFSSTVTLIPEPNIIYLLFAGLFVLPFFLKHNGAEIK